MLGEHVGCCDVDFFSLVAALDLALFENLEFWRMLKDSGAGGVGWRGLWPVLGWRIG